ncbi:uncharacterized protein MAM_07466 [Metarhizium album ARSEF 1941]|uniref:Uncharacterized protein n=1 Tax=Metarhizium album (strain ARSEF 1941) TaxID=1081103 RepID=A0A0B2WFK1_METAS|nr:uncharacterized protein MAM_07466 [Metarhizium album ARSEF 1941]KHN94711.1 hypothetical protein MAM_07466 [Metarhizium album ARSEF 1941]
MSQIPSSSSRSRVMQSTTVASNFAIWGRWSAYDQGFWQHLIDHKIYPEGCGPPNGLPTFEPSDLDSIREALSADRASLSPCQFTQSQFQDFERKNNRATFKNDIMTTIIPILCGDSSIHSQQNVLFTELEPITTAGAVTPKPDFFDGASLVDINHNIRNDQTFQSKVIPSKHANVPVAVNFFFIGETGGDSSVALRQACYNGAYGARAMHALQNYGKVEPAYDGSAYTFTSIYEAPSSTLQLYAHHIVAPANAGGPPEYYMTKIRGFYLKDSYASFVEGVKVFRNARQLAKEHRDRFIQAANMNTLEAQNQTNAEEHESMSQQDADDALQGGVARTGTINSEPGSNASPLQLPADDDSQDLSTVLGSKRARQISSPDNSWGRRSSKSRTRDRINQRPYGDSPEVSLPSLQPPELPASQKGPGRNSQATKEGRGVGDLA